MEHASLVARDVCDGFAGNADLYGLGIRVGIYLQWTSTLLTNVLLPYGISDSLDTNSIFLFALFIATASSTNSRGGLHPIEGFIVLQLCFGFLLSVLSVSGLRLTLLSDPHPELLLQRFRLDYESSNRLPNLGQGVERRATRSLYAQDTQVKLREWIQKMFRKPPNITVSDFEQFWLRTVDLLALRSLPRERDNALDTHLFPFSHVFEPLLLMTDFYVLLRLDYFRMRETSTDPTNSYLKERLLQYQEIRKLTKKVVSLGLLSVFKNDQISWLGIVWRTCIVAGIGIYNVWFWFNGIDVLRTDSCPNFIFLFCKANLLGGARTFFKVLSIMYVCYSSLLLSVCLSGIIAFMQTTTQSLVVNLLVLPYAKMMVLMASTNNALARRWLNGFDVTRSNLFKGLEIPNVRQLLRGIAYLSSASKETVINEEAGHNEESRSRQSVGVVRLKIFFILTTLTIVIWTIVSLELTLKYNSISDVYSIGTTGQLIPLVIGIVGLGKTVNSITINAIKKVYPDWQNIDVLIDVDRGLIIRDLESTDGELAPTENIVMQDLSLHEDYPEGNQTQISPDSPSPTV